MKQEYTQSINQAGAALFSAAMLTFTSCSSNPTPPPAETAGAVAYQEGVPGGVIVNTVKVTAKVTAIDLAGRKVTLLESDGKTFTVKVGPAAVNLDQVRVGDQVNATLTEQLVVSVNEAGAAPGDGSAAVVALAPKGAQPAGLVAETTRVTAKVTAIDLKNRTATLQFEDGSTRTLPVRSDVDLSKRKVGDQVVFQITEMLALSVDKP
jgi:translation elongation factor P/translation initiation factor 5A